MAHGVRYLSEGGARAAAQVRVTVVRVTAVTAIAVAVIAVACRAPAPVPATPELGQHRAGAAARPAPDAAAWRSCLLDGTSPCVSAAPVRLDRELLAWSNWIGSYSGQHEHRHPLGVTECRWVAELEQVLLCGSSDARAMNPGLIRASIFIEVRAHTVISVSDPLFLRYGMQVGGFDLRKDHPDPQRPDLLHFYAALDRACAANRADCPTPHEQAMRALLERAWADKPNFVLVTFAHRSAIPDDEVVSHEILHAQYFTTPAYREVVDAYWAGLTDAQRADVRTSLGGFYNVSDDELVRNELQAYVLMSGGERASLGRFVPVHRAPLLDRLAARGVAPLAVQRRPAMATE
jgi:hypothetical protein